MSVLDLIALPADGSEPGFDGMPLAPGVHLRWSFWPELGWPAGGFEVQRQHWRRDEFTNLYPTAWRKVASLDLPSPGGDVDAAILRRARTASSGLTTSMHKLELYSLRRLIQLIRPRTQAIIDAARGTTHVRLPALDALLLAALDPYVARAIGLAFIDGEIAPTTPVDYRVIGRWSTMTCAWHETEFARLGPADLGGRVAAASACKWWSDRARSLSPATGTPTALQLDGLGRLTLRVWFEVSALEIELELEAPTAAEAASRFRITGRSGEMRLSTTSTPKLTVATSGTTLRILAPPDRLLDELEIADSQAAFTSWRISKFRHRRFSGEIGDQMSQIVRVSPAAGADVAEPHFNVPWPPAEVVTPVVAAVTSEEVSSHLGDDGRVKPRSWQLATSLADPAGAQESWVGLARAVRINTGYLRSADGSGPSRAEMITVHGPRPGAVFSAATTVGRWPLEDLAALSGPALVARGAIRFESVRDPYGSGIGGQLDMQRRTAHMTGKAGPGYLEASGVRGLDGTGTDLQIHLWVLPFEDSEPYPTLVGNDYRQSFWLGLAKDGTAYRPRMWLNGRVFEALGSITQNRWSHVAVHYDGQRIHFFINGSLDVSQVASLGQVRVNPAGKLCIGCDPQAREGAFAFPFRGHLSDLQIRRGADAGFVKHRVLAGWSFDGDLREKTSGLVSGTIGASRFAVEHPETAGRSSLFLDGTWCIAAENCRLADPGNRLCIRLRIKPNAGQERPVIVGSRNWKLWLRAHPSGYQPTLTLGARVSASTAVMPPDRWAELIVGVDGERVVWYLNGEPAGAASLRFGRIPRDPVGRVTIGADATSGAALIAPLRGLIADLEAGDTLPEPAAPVLLVDRETNRNPVDLFSDPTEPDAPLEAAADFVVRDLEPGTYRTLVQGVDVFGRVGRLLRSAPVALSDDVFPPRPGGARARFLPLLGVVTAAAPPDNGSPWQVEVALSRPAPATGPLHPTVINALARHDLELAVVAPAPAESPLVPAQVPDAPARQQIVGSEVCEIVRASGTGDGLSLALHTSPLPRLRPAIGQRVTIAHDRFVRVEWTWTGSQRLLASDVARFRLWERRRLASGVGWTGWVALGLTDGVPVVAGDVVEQGEAAAAIEASQVSHAEWQALRDRGVATLPEPARPGEPHGASRPPARLWRVVLPGAALPANGARLLPHEARPDDFVAGALVAYNSAAEVGAWQLLTVLWHHWTAAGWALYFAENSKGVAAPSTSAPNLSQACYYPGQRYRLDAMLNAPVDFGTGPDGRPIATVALEIAVASVDTAGRQSSIDPAPIAVAKAVSGGSSSTTAMEGSTEKAQFEPRATGSADVVAVDRRRPLPPPRPTVVIERADFHGASRAVVTWAADPAASYQLYRATDSAVYLRDTEQRRLRTGIYHGLAPGQVVSDDPDFTVWLAARWPDWVDDWDTRLFVPRPASGVDAAAWEAATTVWRDWANRFYPTLPASSTSPSDPRTIAALAERAGNEDAFALVNSSPMAGGSYVDQVNGSVRNHYLYRLRSQSASLLHSAVWGPVSDPATAPPTRAPRTPSLVGVYGGDRRITLCWVATTEPEVTAYRVYRARSAEAIEDLRWWQDRADRVAFVVANPRIRIGGQVVSLPADARVRVNEVVAVRRADDPSDGFNLYRENSRLDAGVIRELAPVPDGIAVVVSFREAVGTLGEISGATATFIDEGVEAGVDLHYRIVAEDSAGNRSAPSSVAVGRAYDASPAPAPEWLVSRWDRDAVVLSWRFVSSASLRCVVERSGRSKDKWRPVSERLDPNGGQFAFRDKRVIATADYDYRVRVTTISGIEAVFEAPSPERSA